MQLLFALGAHGGALADPHLHFDDTLVAAQAEGCAFFRGERGDQVEHDLRVLDRFSIDREQDIAGADASRVGRAAAHDAGDQRTFGIRQAEGLGQFGRDFLRLDADPAARDRAGPDDLLHDAARTGHRDGEADAERAAGARVDGSIDADQVALAIDQRAAGVARIDGGIGLDEVLEGVDAKVRTAEGGDDAHGHRLADAERVADGEHDIADAQAVHLAEGDGRQFLGLDLQDGEIGFRVAADDLGLVGLAVVERYLDVVGPLDDVIVGQDIAIGADDDARAKARVLARLSFRALAEEVAEDGVVEQRMAGLADGLRGVDVHHGGQGGPCGVAIGADRGAACLITGRRFLQGDDGLALRQPLRLEGGDDEQEGKRNGCRLCKNQPQPLHGIVSNEA